jgi:hypothetical protein
MGACCACCCCGSDPELDGKQIQLQMVVPVQNSGHSALSQSLLPGSTALREHILRMSFEDLAVTEIVSGSAVYFFSVVSGKTQWAVPPGMLPQSLRQSVSCLRSTELPLSRAVCLERKIELVVHDPTALDAHFGSLITGTAPLLADCAFFDTLLARGTVALVADCSSSFN